MHETVLFIIQPFANYTYTLHCCKQSHEKADDLRVLFFDHYESSLSAEA